MTLPEARGFGVSGWASVDPEAPDDAIDRLVGVPAAWSFRSSSRFEGIPAHRASSAFDSDPGTAWVGDLLPGARPWIEWSSPRRIRLDSVRLAPGAPEHATPARVRVSAGVAGPWRPRSRATGTCGCPLPSAVGASASRSSASGLPGTRRGGYARSRSASWPCRGSSPRAAALRPLRERLCGDVAVRRRFLGGGPSRTRGLRNRAAARLGPRAADARLRGARPAGGDLGAEPGPAGRVFRADHLRLHSAAPEPPARAASTPPRVLDSGHGWNGSRDGVRLDLGDRPAWLVLGESWSRGWRATRRRRRRRGARLGEPEPIDGFASGWLAPRECVTARFEFRRSGSRTPPTCSPRSSGS